MRAVIQRVSEASVTIDGEIRGQIAKGFMVLLGVEEADELDDLQWLVRKISNMRIFEDAEGKMNQSLLDVDGEVLVISQFTLHASCKKGNRPSFTKAARPEKSEPLYQTFLAELSKAIGKPCAAGQFGADMKVALVNDGPVTISLDSKVKE